MSIVITDEWDEQVMADWKRFTAKQKELIRQYIKTGNKLGSYIKVYYDGAYDENRVKRRTVITNCYAEFRKAHVKAVINQIQQKAVKKMGLALDDIVDEVSGEMVERQQDLETIKIDAQWLLHRLAILANFNIKNFIVQDDVGNAVYDFTNATEDDWYCISEYTVEEISRGTSEKYFVDRMKIKSFDKLKALELIGKHVDIAAFKDSIQLSGDEASPIQTITRTIVDPMHGN